MAKSHVKLSKNLTSLQSFLSHQHIDSRFRIRNKMSDKNIYPKGIIITTCNIPAIFYNKYTARCVLLMQKILSSFCSPLR